MNCNASIPGGKVLKSGDCLGMFDDADSISQNIQRLSGPGQAVVEYQAGKSFYFFSECVYSNMTPAMLVFLVAKSSKVATLWGGSLHSLVSHRIFKDPIALVKQSLNMNLEITTISTVGRTQTLKKLTKFALFLSGSADGSIGSIEPPYIGGQCLGGLKMIVFVVSDQSMYIV